MREFQLDEVFIEREFESQTADGQESTVKLLLGKPFLDIEFNEKGQTWNCLRQIIGIGYDKVSPSYGVDGLQSFLLALNMAEAELKAFAKHEHRTITWLGSDKLLSESPK